VQFKKPTLFRLKAQIHDSLLFQIREKQFWETLNEVVQYFSNPIKVRGRDMCIGVDISYGKVWKGKDTKKTTKQEIASFVQAGKLDYAG
jgi:DNA polymerase I-like protein with 3'-5' exonuclease and polymerase domains